MAGFVGKRWAGMADTSRPFACLVGMEPEEAGVCRRVVQIAVAVEERRAISPVRCRLGKPVIQAVQMYSCTAVDLHVLRTRVL
jgi:hypothetical protein